MRQIPGVWGGAACAVSFPHSSRSSMGAGPTAVLVITASSALGECVEQGSHLIRIPWSNECLQRPWILNVPLECATCFQQKEKTQETVCIFCSTSLPYRHGDWYLEFKNKHGEQEFWQMNNPLRKSVLALDYQNSVIFFGSKASKTVCTQGSGTDPRCRVRARGETQITIKWKRVVWSLQGDTAFLSSWGIGTFPLVSMWKWVN